MVKDQHLRAGQGREAGNILYSERTERKVEQIILAPQPEVMLKKNKQLLKLRQLKLFWPSAGECKMIRLKEAGWREREGIHIAFFDSS